MPIDQTTITARRRAQEVHFCRRVRERFKLRVSARRYREWMRLITENAPATRFIVHQPPNRTVWFIVAGGKPMRVVYDHFTDRLVTCLWVGGREEVRAIERANARDRIAKQRRLRTARKTRSF